MLNYGNTSQYSKETTFKREKPFKIVIIGDSNVGKTCIIERYTEDRFGETQPTIGALHKVKTIHDVQLDIWDTAGQERYKSMIPMYYKGAKAIIVTFDISSNASFEGAKKWLEEIESNLTSNEIVITLLANKSDLKSIRVVNQETAKGFCDMKNIHYFECSAKNNIGVKDIFDFIAITLKDMNIKQDKYLQISNNAVNSLERVDYLSKVKSCCPS